jgi:hypothetical protein
MMKIFQREIFARIWERVFEENSESFEAGKRFGRGMMVDCWS